MSNSKISLAQQILSEVKHLPSCPIKDSLVSYVMKIISESNEPSSMKALTYALMDVDEVKVEESEIFVRTKDNGWCIVQDVMLIARKAKSYLLIQDTKKRLEKLAPHLKNLLQV